MSRHRTPSPTATHTPGPWKVYNEAKPPFLVITSTEDDTRSDSVAYVGTQAAQIFVCRQTLANARLIAAAPELLASLRSVLEHFADGLPHYDDHEMALISEARAAIGRATGA